MARTSTKCWTTSRLRKRNAPVHVFVHGGAWKNFTKSDYSFPAESFVAAGFHTVVLNFSKLPTVRLPEMVEQVRRGVAWVYKNAAQYGGDPDRLSISAHSSGAHLAANALITDWTAFGCPPDIVKAAACVSGPYDLEPVMLSARSSYVELDDAEVAALSINRHTDRIPCPVTIAYADGDTDEFRRQSQEFANALRRSGRLADCRCFTGLNHFEIMEQFGEPESDLDQLCRQQHRTRRQHDRLARWPRLAHTFNERLPQIRAHSL